MLRIRELRHVALRIDHSRRRFVALLKASRESAVYVVLILRAIEKTSPMVVLVILDFPLLLRQGRSLGRQVQHVGLDADLVGSQDTGIPIDQRLRLVRNRQPPSTNACTRRAFAAESPLPPLPSTFLDRLAIALPAAVVP